MDPTYYSATSTTFVGQLFGLLGLKSIADSAKGVASSGGYPQLSAEFILKANPTYIFLADTICCKANAASVAKRPGWSAMSAVKDHRIVPLNDDIASRWGPRIVILLQDVANALNGERGVDFVVSTPTIQSLARGDEGPPSRPRRSRHAGRCRHRHRFDRGHSRQHRDRTGRPLDLNGGRGFALARPLVHFHSSAPTIDQGIVWDIRLPRVILGGMVGAMLAAGGASYQGVFRNPLADPYLLGVAAGAGLGATIVIVSHWGTTSMLPVAAFIGGTAAVTLTYFVGAKFGGRSSGTSVVLAGVAVAALFTAAQTALQQQHSADLQAVYAWILGSLNFATWSDVWLILPYVVGEHDGAPHASPPARRPSTR